MNHNVTAKALRVLACLLIFGFLAISAAAQTVEKEELGKNELTVWSGFSPDSNTEFGSGRIKNARLGIAAVRYARRFDNGRIVNLKYAFDAIPAAVLRYPDVNLVQAAANAVQLRQARKAVYGYGISPLGLQINFRPHKRIQPFIEGTGGLLYFNKQIPQIVGTRFAYTANAGAGVEIRLKKKRAVSIGYKYFHISNGGRGIENPGFDNNLFYVGYTLSH